MIRDPQNNSRHNEDSGITIPKAIHSLVQRHQQRSNKRRRRRLHRKNSWRTHINDKQSIYWGETFGEILFTNFCGKMPSLFRSQPDPEESPQDPPPPEVQEEDKRAMIKAGLSWAFLIPCSLILVVKSQNGESGTDFYWFYILMTLVIMGRKSFCVFPEGSYPVNGPSYFLRFMRFQGSPKVFWFLWGMKVIDILAALISSEGRIAFWILALFLELYCISRY